MSRFNILLIPGEPEWTSRAMHLACAMARSNGGEVTLLKMAPAGHPALLGSPEGSRFVRREEMRAMAELARTAEKYDVPANVTVCQYASYTRAMVDVAEQLAVAALFATVPPSHIPFWARYQEWRVRSILARHGCTLYTVEPAGGPLEWAPSATQPATATPVVSPGKESHV
jgi:hypothetical protein